MTDLFFSKYKNITMELYSIIKRISINDKITKTNVIDICIKLMQLVEKYPNIKGEEKKRIVITVLKQFITDTLIIEEQLALLLFIEQILPSIIDTLISIDKKELTIKIRKGFKSLFTCC